MAEHKPSTWIEAKDALMGAGGIVTAMDLLLSTLIKQVKHGA